MSYVATDYGVDKQVLQGEEEERISRIHQINECRDYNVSVEEKVLISFLCVLPSLPMGRL
jgi:hypothetical protein